MNEYQKQMMDKPSIETECCAICGRYQVERHHIVPRSQGGTDGPTITLCGFGNTGGCHGLAHNHRLHFKYENGWMYLLTSEPMKDELAYMVEGWRYVES